MAAMQEVYTAGAYRHFGISNRTPGCLKKVYAYTELRNFMLPTVFQGNHEPVALRYDIALFPPLQDLNIAIHMDASLVGGVLVKSSEMLSNSGGEG